jgi:hypothetical protein
MYLVYLTLLFITLNYISLTYAGGGPKAALSNNAVMYAKRTGCELACMSTWDRADHCFSMGGRCLRVNGQGKCQSHVLVYDQRRGAILIATNWSYGTDRSPSACAKCFCTDYLEDLFNFGVTVTGDGHLSVQE